MAITRTVTGRFALSLVVSLLPAAACVGGGENAKASSPQAVPTSSGVRFAVNSAASRHPISPYIYGVNQFDWGGRTRHLKLGRLGGNRFTAFNWENNASNAGSDYNHQNDDLLGGGDKPGEAVREPVEQAQKAGASMIVTVPIAGYVAADKERDGDVNKTPDYLHKRFLESKPAKGAPYAYPPDRKDRLVYQDEFVAWLEGAFPNARRDPERTIFYSLDNEPDLWTQTHPRIRPQGKVTYAELMERTVAFATGIKNAAPQALVFGPASYGWTGFNTLQDAADSRRRNFLDFYLDSMREAEARAGHRLLDVLDLHWYPEARGGGVRVVEDNNKEEVVAARVQAPRSLWDASYVETSWISQDAGAGAIRLIPRMKEKIAAHYPGTRLAITEYNFGGGGHISGALAQADVLGIFGREGLFAAAMWEMPGGTKFLDAAFAAFTNYDGQGGRFGQTSIEANTSDDAASSVYASVDEGRDDRMVLVVINKTAQPLPAELKVSHPAELTRAQSWQISAASPSLQKGPEPKANGGNTFALTLPPTSVVTIVLTR
jgi:hypothetical protein